MITAIVSNRGGRSNNEDAVGRLRIGSMLCYVLADGLGGHENGEIASKLAVDTILECFKVQPGMTKELVYAYLEAAHHAVIEKRRTDFHGMHMGTTIAVLITDGERAIWGHCGDSRIYRLKKHLIQEVSDDHSVAFSVFAAGEIQYSQIRYSPDQNKLLRSLGGESFRPDISEVIKLPSKTSFLLCSDGFWEYVTEDFMENTRKKADTPKLWLKEMLNERRRNAPPDADNYSAIAVYI